MSECKKLSDRTEEWNHIYPFMEWLQERGFFLCRNDTKEDAIARGEHQFKDGSYFLFPYPLPIGKSIEQLLYEYFEVNPMKLEKERRALLEKLRTQRDRRNGDKDKV